jgi:predicted metal-dependent HD superfamily phosphohydrolase
LVVDVDLPILGSPPDAYERYEAAVRREYKWVPAFVFRRKRREILESFLRRDAIFLTEPFFERYESQARSNLSRACSKLA